MMMTRMLGLRRTPLWNLTLIAATDVDLVMTMSTYTDNFTLFEKHLVEAVTTLKPSQVVIGLESIRPSDKQPYTPQQMQQRFALIKQYGVRKLGVWDAPIPDDWFPLLKDWAAGQ
jgi:spore germination protein YaaH